MLWSFQTQQKRQDRATTAIIKAENEYIARLSACVRPAKASNEVNVASVTEGLVVGC
jgi:hypothetical protein